MLFPFCILLSLALILATVVILHKRQSDAVRINADRYAPLPPLNKPRDIDFGEATPTGEAVSTKPASNNTQDLPHTRVPLAEVSPATETRPDAAVKRASAGKPAFSADRLGPDPRLTQHPTTASHTVKPPEPSANCPVHEDWQDLAAALKAEGKLEQALQVCQQHLPLWGAYQQIAVLLRQLLRQQKQPELRVELLQSLYRNACDAELLHNKTVLPRLSLGRLRQIGRDQIAALPVPYSEIGYVHLRLIKKSDVKALQQVWGKPGKHRKPREYHRQAWQALVAQIK